MNSNKDIFIIEKLEFSYDNEPSLFADMSINIPYHGVTMITGGNGTGKTTLCRLLTGLAKGYKGSLKFLGKELATVKPDLLLGQVAYIKQDLNGNLLGVVPDDDLKVWQNRFSEPDTDDRIRLRKEALQLMAPGLVPDTPFWKLSYGQKRKAMLAALPLFSAKYWIIDEPAASIDAKGLESLINIIKQKTDKYCGCLILTHRPGIFSSLQQGSSYLYQINNRRIMRVVDGI